MLQNTTRYFVKLISNYKNGGPVVLYEIFVGDSSIQILNL